MKDYCHVKFDAFRRKGEGEYIFSRVLLRGMPNETWTATIWLKKCSKHPLISQSEGTAIVVDRNKQRKQFSDSDVLIRYLIENLGYTFLLNNLEESR